MFKTDEYVICVDKKLSFCKYGKRYKIFSIEKHYKDPCREVLYIYNDNKKLCEYYSDSFISISEYRKQKILKINEISRL